MVIPGRAPGKLRDIERTVGECAHGLDGIAGRQNAADRVSLKGDSALPAPRAPHLTR